MSCGGPMKADFGFEAVFNLSGEIEFITIFMYVIYIVVLSQNIRVSKGITYVYVYWGI